MKYNYKEFRDLDFVFTTGLNFISCRIRITEAGIRNVFNTTIGTHEGRLISMGNGGVRAWYVMEMDPMGDKAQPGSLKLHNVSKYLDNGVTGSRIVAIKRSPVYDDEKLRQYVVENALAMWQEGKTFYDVGGCIAHDKFFHWLGAKDNPKKYYCSEWSEYIDQQFGKFSTVGMLGKGDNVTPWTHQKSIQTKGIQWMA